VINMDVMDGLQLPAAVIDKVAAHELHELERRKRAYRDDQPAPDVGGRTVILVDDGLATGSTIRTVIAGAV